MTTETEQATGAGAELSQVEKLNEWLSANLYHNREFKDVDSLVALKEKSGETISLVLPTLNEESTIGNIVRTMKEALVDEHPLLDEIIVIDSGSTDRTREEAEAAGAEFHYSDDYLTDLASYKGKGENLWKSLYVARGDIIVWIDSDIKNIDPKFAYGIIGPLLENPELGYCKGFYQRPIQVGGKLRKSGGGRVTEILMKPLINHFFPELSGFIQPLSGEYGGRRKFLEEIPFFTGYGVEIGMLIDIVNRFGLESMAQVDLEMRVHRNQKLENLGKMAFGILQGFFKRCHELEIIDLAKTMEETLHMVKPDTDEGPNLVTKSVVEFERPPMAEVPEYREKFKQKLTVGN